MYERQCSFTFGESAPTRLGSDVSGVGKSGLFPSDVRTAYLRLRLHGLKKVVASITVPDHPTDLWMILTMSLSFFTRAGLPGSDKPYLQDTNQISSFHTVSYA